MRLFFKDFFKLSIKEHKELLSIRNNEYVRNNMKSNSIIEIEKHLSWVNSLQSDKNNRYYVVYEENCIVGAIYITDINEMECTSYWGLYFKKNVNPLVSSISAILIIEKIFHECNTNKLYSEVKNENVTAYKFNETLGFKKEKTIDKNFYKLSITVDDWKNNKNNRIIKTLKKRLDKIEYKFV